MLQTLYTKYETFFNGGCCLVAWEKVAQPINLGGSGNLKPARYGLGLADEVALVSENRF